MISFRLELYNPFARSRLVNSDVYSETMRVSKHKHVELQFNRTDWTHPFMIDVDTQFTGQDHAGFMFAVQLLCFYFHVQLYDERHWDYDNGCWEKGDDR